MIQQNLKNTNVFIRRAQISDAESLVPLCTLLGYPTDVKSVESRLQKNAGKPESAIFVAENADGQLVGFIDLCLCCLLINDSNVEVWGFVVNEPSRRCGYGRALIKEAEKWAAEIGAENITLRSNVIRKEAHLFYESLGFERYKQQYAFRKNVSPLD